MDSGDTPSIEQLTWSPDERAADGRALIHIPLRVDAGHAGYRLDRYLAGRFKGLSRNRISTMIEQGRVRRHGDGTRLQKSALRVREGECLVVSRPAPEEPSLDLELKLLHQDEALLVVDKAAGLPVHPSARYHNYTLTALLRAKLGAGHGWEMAHRLDRETSGVMVFGRAGGSGPQIKDAFSRREVAKEYLAIVRGELTGTREISIPLGTAAGSRVLIKQGPRAESEGGLRAHTDVEGLAVGSFRGEAVSLVRARPKTGRTHQIRVHLDEIGHPILGDKLYGLDEQNFLDVVEGSGSLTALGKRLGLSRHALHAHALTLPHPLGGARVRYESPWPAELVSVMPLPADEA